MSEQRKKELAKEWLKSAKHDLEWAEGSLGLKEYAGVCFLAQQIVEKSLKAFLYSKGEDLRKIHDLDKLLKLVITHESSLAKFKEATVTLSGYYLQTRYPDIGDINVFNKKDLAEEALSWAREIYLLMEKLITS